MNIQRKSKRTNDLLTQSVAHRLKELRIQRNLPQEYVYENTGLNLSRIESGETNLSLVTLDVLCRFYQVELHELFTDISTIPLDEDSEQ